jgi:uncharacterized protein YmfQ (DUF2313 family)
MLNHLFPRFAHPPPEGETGPVVPPTVPPPPAQGLTTRPHDRHVTRSGDEYADAFAELLPTGQAWPRDDDGVLMTVVRGLSKIWGMVESAASLLLEQESDPRTTILMLPDWERNWGLPDPCYAEPFTIGDRQKALVQRMTIEGAQSRAFFIATALSIGYVITITEYRPFMVGIDRCGDNRQIGDGSVMQDQFGNPLYDEMGVPLAYGVMSEYPYMLGPPGNRSYWKVHVHAVRLTWFRAGGGGGQAGVDPHLRLALATDLECLLRRWKPAHTDLIFDYSGLAVGGSMAGTP